MIRLGNRQPVMFFHEIAFKKKREDIILQKKKDSRFSYDDVFLCERLTTFKTGAKLK